MSKAYWPWYGPFTACGRRVALPPGRDATAGRVALPPGRAEPSRPGRRRSRERHPAVWQCGDMCGRYASARKKHELLEEFQVELDGEPDKELGADFNVAPTKNVYAVMS